MVPISCVKVILSAVVVVIVGSGSSSGSGSGGAFLAHTHKFTHSSLRSMWIVEMRFVWKLRRIGSLIYTVFSHSIAHHQ